MIKDIKIDSYNSFVLLENKDLWGCGKNKYGELGIGNTEQINTFVKICENVEKIKSYPFATFLFKKDKTLWFTGSGFYLNKKKNITSFIKIANDIKDILCWESPKGKKILFCLKNNGNLLNLKESKIYSSNVKKIIRGYRGKKSCLFFIKKDDSLLLFEEKINNKFEFFGEVKNVFSSYNTPIFIQKTDDSLWKVEKDNFKKSIKFFDDIKDVKIFDNGFFFLRKNGDMFVLGKNRWGELGTEQEEVNIPTLVAKNVKEIYPSYYYTLIFIDRSAREICPFCAYTLILKNDNSLWGCGKNIYNILGNEPENYSFYSFKKICDDVKKIYINEGSLFIIKHNNELWVSGWNKKYFQGTDYLRFISNNVENVFSNSNSSLILKRDNTLFCFGDNRLGQLGIGLEKDEVNELTECTVIKNYYNTKEAIKIIKDIFKGGVYDKRY